MLNSSEVFEMEKKLKESISLGFFEHGTNGDMDTEIYKAYSSVQRLRKFLEEREKLQNSETPAAGTAGESDKY